jgi:hypothetical protein
MMCGVCHDFHFVCESTVSKFSGVNLGMRQNRQNSLALYNSHTKVNSNIKLINYCLSTLTFSFDYVSVLRFFFTKQILGDEFKRKIIN